MKRLFYVGAAIALLVSLAGVPTLANEDKHAGKKASIDESAQSGLDALFESSPDAKDLYNKAYGWSVFTNIKVAVGVSGGGGSGVAVKNGDESRTYMKMGTAGIGLGLGGQKYQVIFLFETEKAFTNFVEKGWQADAGAQASAGTAGANAKTTFHNGMAIFQITDSGLMASADIAGTKYWKNKKLNK